MQCRFKELRQEKGLTQEEFRILFNTRYHRNYTPSAISRFENNKRIPETAALIDFADFFHVSLDYLLGVSDKKQETPTTNKPIRVTANFDTEVIITAAEKSLLEAYRKASDRDKNIVDAVLKPSISDAENQNVS